MDAEATGTFAEFHDAHARKLGVAIALCLNDVHLANAATRAGLVRTARRWTRLRDTDPAGYALGAAIAWAERNDERFASKHELVEVFTDAARDNAGDAESVTDGDAELRTRVGDLPVRQRCALVCTEWLGWDFDRTATAFEREVSTIELRHRRAYGALRSAYDQDVPDPARVRDVLEQAAGDVEATGDDAESLNRLGRRRTLRDRALLAVAGLSVIAGVGGLISAGPAEESEPVAEVATVDPPNASQAPHAPISDGKGGFVALALGGGQLSTSRQGVEWLPQSRFNVQRRDLRLSVERFFRSDGRYLAIVESSSGGGNSVAGTDQPLIATSDTLRSWDLLPVRLDALTELPESIGLRPRINLLSAAAAGNHVLVAITVEQRVDFQAQRVRSSDICTVATDSDGVALHRCDGEVIVIADQASVVDARADRPRLLLSTDGGAFVEVPTDDDFNPYGLFSFDGRFAMIDEATSQLSWSDDGRVWEPLFSTGVDNRLGLVAGAGDQALAIVPTDEGWTSQLLQDEQVIAGTLPIDIDPATIWLKPEIVHGPAGWALFMTSSRPWERGAPESELGWAVYEGDLIIEQRSGDGSVRLRSTDATVDYEYRGPVAGSSPGIERSLFGGVRLFRPGTSELILEISGDTIRDSWVTDSASVPARQGDFVVDGYTLSGNIRVGPVQVERPDGSVSTFDDGFAFTNGDTADGVEADPPWGQVEGEAELRLFDSSGDLELAVAMSELTEALDPEVIDEQTGAKALVAFSPDGVQWDVVWDTARDTWYGSVAVGDDELLLSISGIGSGPQRIALPE